MRYDLDRSQSECGKKSNLIRYRSNIRADDQDIQLGISNHLHLLSKRSRQHMKALNKRSTTIFNQAWVSCRAEERHLKKTFVQMQAWKSYKSFRLNAEMRIQNAYTNLLASATLPLWLDGHMQLQTRLQNSAFNNPSA